ncbi:FimV/HubP family polar landmark protein [Candidatus Thiothrix anitrata]|jgi:FimV-like protein|uniref:FimV N-terminal domain-containing protein n=1 Tax=Candidatus Thiothrix anitrata TaxID=2823902 RepID=A0ABX7X764_9GAMM|nr:FimV/HubP family polar landmark protein [Candidatus Thiothrix anitrata]QTR50783.1 hypothetical protein J8380_04220 [Candidatus Thiothrix anitrata]
MKNPFLSLIFGLLLSIGVGIQPATAANTYGPTKAQETLWSIASRLRPTYDVSTQQMMLAIRAKNPQAFITSNINTLKKGSILKLPTLGEIQQLDRIQALHTARQQNRYWQAQQKATKTKPARNTVQVKNKRVNLNTARTTQQRLKREINTLKSQLKQEQQRSSQLSAKIRELQAATSATPTTTADLTALRSQVTEMKTVLAEKDTHIKNLQASLKDASESIKRQYAENQALYDKLRTASPESVPEPPTAASNKPQLTLAEVPADRPVATSSSPKPPAVFTDQVTDVAAAKGIGTPLTSLLEQQNAAVTNASATAASNNETATPQTTANSVTPSRLSFIIALISLLFILALLWRAFSQQRSLRKEPPSHTPESSSGEKLNERTEPKLHG